MIELTTEEKVFLVESYYSRGKNYSNVFCDFHGTYGRSRAKNNDVLKRVIDNFIEYGTVEGCEENFQRSIELTTKEKVFLIESYYSRGKIYDEAFKDFRAEYGRSRVESEAALKRVIDNFKTYGTVKDCRENLQRSSTDSSIELTTEEKVFLVESYYSRGKNYSNVFCDFHGTYGRSRAKNNDVLKRVIDNFISYGTVEGREENLQRSIELTTKEKVFLVESYYSRGKIYDEAFKDFRAEYGRSRVENEAALKRVIDNFKTYGTVH